MTRYTSDLLRLLDERGYIHQLTDAAELDALASRQIVPGYVGFDATARSLHVGHLIQIMLLRRVQQAGHKPIVLVGGGTSKIGDPSFKDEARKLMTTETVAENIRSIRPVFERFLTFGNGPTDAVLLDNAEWLDALEYIPFLRDIGQHFSVNRMLSFDSVKLRLDREQSLSFLEFNYMILQGYDFRELARRQGARLQMGGSDQWGNIVNGIELARRMDGTEVFGVTTPLLTTADGQKMGKTVSGAVWLHEDQLPHFDYWQFWRNADDRDVGRFLRLFTDLPLEEIARLEALPGAQINEAKKMLATEATAMLHGREAANAAAAAAAAAFEQGRVSGDLPTVSVPHADLEAGVPISALAADAGLASSRSEARRLAQGGGLRLNDEPEKDGMRLVTLADLRDGAIKLAAGKKKIVLIRPEE